MDERNVIMLDPVSFAIATDPLSLILLGSDTHMMRSRHGEHHGALPSSRLQRSCGWFEASPNEPQHVGRRCPVRRVSGTVDVKIRLLGNQCFKWIHHSSSLSRTNSSTFVRFPAASRQDRSLERLAQLPKSEKAKYLVFVARLRGKSCVRHLKMSLFLPFRRSRGGRRGTPA